MRRILFAFAVLLLLVPAAALAYPVQEFSAGVKDIKPDGRFTLVYSSRTYDSSGGIPPALRENYLRIPLGAVVRKEFLKKKYYCDADKLLKDLQAAPEQNVQFARRVDKEGCPACHEDHDSLRSLVSSGSHGVDTAD